MKINKLYGVILFSSLLGGCLKDANDKPVDNSTPLLVVTCDSAEEGKLTGCWVSTKCESYDPSVHAASSPSGNFLRESFSVSKQNGTISSAIEFFSDENCENSVGKSEQIDHGSVVYGEVFTNANGLEVSEYKVQAAGADKISYFYLNGNQMCFPENSFVLHMLSRANDETFNELDRSIDFDRCFDSAPQI